MAESLGKFPHEIDEMPLDDFNQFLAKNSFCPLLSKKLDFFDARQYLSDKNKDINKAILFKTPQIKTNKTTEQIQDQAFEFVSMYTG